MIEAADKTMGVALCGAFCVKASSLAGFISDEVTTEEGTSFVFVVCAGLVFTYLFFGQRYRVTGA